MIFNNNFYRSLRVNSYQATMAKEQGITFLTPQYVDRLSPTFTDLRSNRTLKTIPGFTVWPNKGALLFGLSPNPRERSLRHAIALLWEHGVTAQRMTVY